MLSVKEMNEQTWNDFEKLFAKHNGVCGGCWCMYHRLRSSQFQRMTKEERRLAHYNLTLQGKGAGLIVYDDELQVAWCQFGKAEYFPQYDYGRAYSKLEIPEEFKPKWRISCLFVDKHRRKEKLSSFALAAAIKLIKQQGGGVVEAFPLDVNDTGKPSYTGAVRMYSKHGFQEVSRLGKNTVFMRAIL